MTKKSFLIALSFALLFLHEIKAQPVLVSAIPQNSYGFFEVGSNLYFFHQDSLWRSNGTAGGTVFVRDLGSQPVQYYELKTYYHESEPFVAGTTFFFVTKSGSGFVLWRSNGTTAGTTIVGTYNDIKPLEVVNNELYYGALVGTSSRLYKVGGGAPVLLSTINLAPYPAEAFSPTRLRIQIDHEVIGNTLYFGAYTGTTPELWKSNGTAAGTVEVKEFPAGTVLNHFEEVNGVLFFAAGADLWKSNGTTAGTTVVRGFETNDDPSIDGFIEYKEKLYFILSGSGLSRSLYVSDGTEAGTTIVKSSFGTESYVINMGVANDKIYIAISGQIPMFLYMSDGTPAGTVFIKEFNSFSPEEFTPAANHLFFADHTARSEPFLDYPITPEDAWQLWQSDLSLINTDAVKTLFPGTSFPNATNLTEVNETLYFTTPGMGNTLLYKYNPLAPATPTPFFSLINAQTDEVRDWIRNGDTIALYPGDQINIQYNPSGTSPESVRLTLNGSVFTTENEAPYALAGDLGGDFKPWTTVAQGNYNLIAQEYSGNNASGTLLRTTNVSFYVRILPQNQAPVVNAGVDKSITLPTTSTTLSGTASDPGGSIASVQWTFISGPPLASPVVVSPNSANTSVTGLTIPGVYRFRFTATDNLGVAASDDILVTVNSAPSGPAVTSFTLINADTDMPIMTLTNGAVLNYATLPTDNLSIRANTNPATVGSVRFFFDTFTRVENGAPYSLYGDVGTNYQGNTFNLGSHTVTATPYPASGATGTAGTTLSVTFNVINSGMRISSAISVSAACYPNPSADDFRISVEIKENTLADVSIFDMNGKLQANLFQGEVNDGETLNLNWAPKNLPKGIYLLKIKTGDHEKIEKLIFE